MPALERFLEQQADESHVFDEVAPEHAARLLQETVEPFEPGALHPERGPLDLADGDVEGAADTHGEGNPHMGLVLAEELLLLGRTDRHEQQVGLAGEEDVEPDEELEFGAALAEAGGDRDRDRG